MFSFGFIFLDIYINLHRFNWMNSVFSELTGMSEIESMRIFVGIRVVILILLNSNVIFSSYFFLLFPCKSFFSCMIFKITIVIVFINSVFGYISWFSICVSSPFFFFDLSRKNCFLANLYSWLLKFGQIKIECSWLVWLSDNWWNMASKLNSLLKSYGDWIKMEVNIINEVHRNATHTWSEDWIVSVWVNIFNCLSFKSFLNRWHCSSWWSASNWFSWTQIGLRLLRRLYHTQIICSLLRISNNRVRKSMVNPWTILAKFPRSIVVISIQTPVCSNIIRMSAI